MREPPEIPEKLKTTTVSHPRHPVSETESLRQKLAFERDREASSLSLSLSLFLSPPTLIIRAEKIQPNIHLRFRAVDTRRAYLSRDDRSRSSFFRTMASRC